MAKPEKPRSGFVIKLSNETAQKLAEEEQLAKAKAEIPIVPIVLSESSTEDKIITEQKPDRKQNTSLEVTSIESVKTDDVSSNKEKNDSKVSEEDNSDSSNPEWGDYTPYITYEGEEAIYTDPTTKLRYTWSKDTNSWTTKNEDTSRVYSYENDTHVYTESDGSKSFWDDEKKAWLPKVDDDFLAFYQMSYGFVENKEEKKEDKPKEVKKKSENPPTLKRKVEPTWFEPTEEKNTKVYVSNLPLDINEEEFVNFMQKCGLVERDPSNQKMKVKLYIDKDQNCFKGDALCTYIKIESVDLALKILDGCDFKGNKIKVERAHFQLKGEYNPALKPKKKRKKELEKLKKMQQKLFDWRPEKFIGERSKHERVVIVKNLFHPSDFDNEVQLILDYQQDLREECGKSGEVRKVVIYDRHPEGVAQITMKEPEQADAAVALINGRWFGKRQITAEIWDGRTKYRIAETDADLNKRVDKWGKFLEGKEGEEEKGETKDKESPNEPESTVKTVESTVKTVESTDKTVESMDTETVTNEKGETKADKEPSNEPESSIKTFESIDTETVANEKGETKADTESPNECESTVKTVESTVKTVESMVKTVESIDTETVANEKGETKADTESPNEPESIVKTVESMDTVMVANEASTSVTTEDEVAVDPTVLKVTETASNCDKT